MVVRIAWNRKDSFRLNRIAMIKVTYDKTNTTLTIPTGLKKINSYDVSPANYASVSTYGGVTLGAVSGGTVTLTVSDSTPNSSYIFVTAFGI